MSDGPEVQPLSNVDVRGVAVGHATVDEWRDALTARVGTGDIAHHHVSLNAAKWIALRHDPALRNEVRTAGSIGADGIAIVWLARWLGTPLPARAPGIEIAEAMLERAAVRSWRIALVGARPEVVEAVRDQLLARGIAVVIAVQGHGPLDGVAEAVAEVHPDLLLVALGTPRAEHWIAAHRHRWPGAVVLGVGGAFDVWAGKVRRAPAWARSQGLEGVARFMAEPRRRFRRAVVDSLRFALAAARGVRVPS